MTKPMWIPATTIIVLSLLIRLIGLGAESAWIDEGYSIALARHSVADILRGTAADQHPPVYYLLLHFWQGIGTGIVAARVLSVLLGVLNVYQILVFGLRLRGQWLGLGAALLLAVNPMHVWYSQEIRQYMLLLVLTTASMMEFWTCLHGKRRWWAYGLFTLLALYTQYFAVFILLAQVVLGIAYFVRERNKSFLRGWIFSLLIVGLLFVPWLPTAINQLLNHTLSWIGEPDAGQVRDIPLRLILGSGIVTLPDWIRWSGFALIIFTILWVLWGLYKRRIETSRVFALLIAWALVPFLAITSVSIFYPLFQFKQFLILLPAFIMVLTAILELFPRWWKYLLYLGFLVIPLVSLAYQQITLSKDDWRGLCAHIQANYQPGDVIYTNPAAAELALDLYLDSSIVVQGYPPDYDILTGGWDGQPVTLEIAEQELSALIEVSDRLWLVEFFPEFWDSHGFLPRWLNENAVLLDDMQYGNIRLRLYRFGQASP